jgi:hypothetical protein
VLHGQSAADDCAENHKIDHGNSLKAHRESRSLAIREFKDRLRSQREGGGDNGQIGFQEVVLSRFAGL